MEFGVLFIYFGGDLCFITHVHWCFFSAFHGNLAYSLPANVLWVQDVGNFMIFEHVEGVGNYYWGTLFLIIWTSVIWFHMLLQLMI